ncbi:hypothetical protein AS034_05810 [[Bacillus] enclensis]|nr:hypothetical protein AS034_05810 [[Bacillus] enclensis]
MQPEVLLKLFCFYRLQLLIGVPDEDSCGRSDQCETPQGGTTEEAHGSPAESEVWHGNQKRCSVVLIDILVSSKNCNEFNKTPNLIY